MSGVVYHVSEDATITRFEPRVTPTRPGEPPRVWAIGDRRLFNYYFPRDCPRVTFWARPDSAAADVERLLGYTTARYVTAIERDWLDRLRQIRLYVYHLPADTFTLIDAAADYYVSTAAVTPLSVVPTDDLLAWLVAADVEVRITPSLWPLYRAVIASTLDFSIIRMRNARPEETAGPTTAERPG